MLGLRAQGQPDKDSHRGARYQHFPPAALVRLAGQRVIANTIKAELPEGFQKAEFLLEHGFIDKIVPRQNLRSELARLIDYCTVQQ